MKYENYSKEFLDKLTEDFLSGPLAQYDRQRIGKKITEIRKADHCPIFLEMLHAVHLVLLEDAVKCIAVYGELSKFDDLIREAQDEADRHSDLIFNALYDRPSRIAKTGGDARSALFKALENETIRLYKSGNWTSLPSAALEITPKIVALSKNGNGDLVETTNKPLQWLRKYAKSQRSKPS